MRRSAHVVYMIIMHIYVIISYVLFNDFRLAECIPKRNIPLITNGQRHLTHRGRDKWPLFSRRHFKIATIS